MAVVATQDKKKGGGGGGGGGNPFLKQKTFQNSLGQHVALSEEVFEQMYGADWNSQRAAKEMTSMDFSSSMFMLETLEGPEGGIMSEKCRPCRKFIRTLNIANNALTDIDCIDRRQPRQYASSMPPEFPVLAVLIASRNQILNVQFSNLDNLQELNLAYNELEIMPDTSGLQNLQKLILAHNKLKGTMRPLAKNKRLKELLIHDNQFSWKPTEFESQMQILKQNHLYRLTIWPNPFALNFPEYQFLAVTIIDTLTSLDGYEIDQDLKLQLQNLEEDMRDKDGLDFSVFDIKVSERTSQLGGVPQSEGVNVSRSQIPSLSALLRKLEKPLDHPDQLIKYVYEFNDLIKYLWGAHYTDRQSRMTMDIKDDDELRVQVGEFGDKMQQLLGRFDSVQDVLVKCLVRLCASGNRQLSEMSAMLLAEWVDALPPELSEKLQTISTPLFRELRVRMLPGMQSFQDKPDMCFQASFPELMEANAETNEAMESGFFGKKNAIAETAEILAALGKFGRAGFAQRPVHNNRAIVLRPLLPALCRVSRKALGEEKPRDDCAPYENFSYFDGAEVGHSSFQGPRDGFKEVCISRAARQNSGGFVVSEVATSSSLLEAKFVHETADSIRGMRVPTEGKILFVMPAVAQVVADTEEVEVEKMMTWEVWHNCLNVLCVATSDPDNAARCVMTYQIHKDIPKYELEVFTESLLNITNEASKAFTSLLHLARNLMSATSVAAQEAKDYFSSSHFHTRCWRRLRMRMNQVGAQKTENTMLLSALVRVVFEMSKGVQGHAVMKDLSEGMDDVFNAMLDIASNTEAPDPLMLAASLETLWMFLNDEDTRKLVVTKVLTKLHELAILLPYIRGPIIGDVDNNKYQDLWRQCEINYGSDSHGRERMPQLWEGGKNSDWRKKVPEIKDMRNPLMHRVMLGVVRLLELISDKADTDQTGEFKRVADMLNSPAVSREDMLIGPQNGLILVPDYDVKIEVLRVIGHVLKHMPQQFTPQELGWVLRYLTSKNLGYGRQEEFLIEVLKLVKLLVEDNSNTGFIFRQQFAKSAIRQAYDMLKVNSSRETAGGADAEASKTALSLEIVAFLGTCSKPRTGGLRPFLRRVDFLQTVKAVMKQEDGKAFGLREPLLRTWTGRNMREVLYPLVTMNELDVKGMGRYRSLVRMADVLMGKMDYDSAGNTLISTDEALMWPGDNAISRTLIVHDDALKTDTMQQQRDFLAGGLDPVWGFGDRLFMSNSFASPYTKAMVAVKDWARDAHNFYQHIWATNELGGVTNKSTKRHEEKKEVEETKLEHIILSRLKCINARIGREYKTNLSTYKEKTKVNSLSVLAEKFLGEVRENMKIQEQYYDDDDWETLAGEEIEEEVDNQYYIDGKPYTREQLKAQKKKLVKCRQTIGNLEDLYAQAHLAQIKLKEYLLARGDAADPATEKWANMKWEVDDPPEDDGFDVTVSKGLLDFLVKNECRVTDPGIVPKAKIKRMAKYKYQGDLTRCRAIARIVIEVKDLPTMIQVLKDLKKNTRFPLLLIRNRFKYPTSLGTRFFQVFVEVVVGNDRHIAELKLVLVEGGPGGFLKRETDLKNNMEMAIRGNCTSVEDRQIEEVTEFLIYEMQSRSIRSGDVLYIHSPGLDKYLSIDTPPKEMCHVRPADDEPLNQLNLFTVSRREYNGTEYQETPGPVRTGDIILLQSFFTQNYIDISATNHGVRCRYNDPDAEQSNLKMQVEAAPERKQEQFAGLSMLSSMDEVEADAASKVADKDKSKAKKKHFHKEEPKNVHNAANIMLKVYGVSSPQRRVTVKKAQSWGSDKQGLKAEPRFDDELADPQIFVFYLEGSLDIYLQAPNMATAEANAICVSGAQTEEQKQDKVLTYAYMKGTLSVQAPLEGGMFRRAPPTFEDIARKQSTGKSGAEVQQKDDLAQGIGVDLRTLPPLELQRRLGPLVVAAACRCIYALVQAPSEEEFKVKVLDEVLGTPETSHKLTMMSRFLALGIAGCTNEQGEVDYDTLCAASLSAKLLRTFSKCLSKMPANSMPAEDSMPVGAYESWKQKQKEKEEKGLYDKQRLSVLQILSNYIKEILVPPLLQRLAVASQKPLNMAEVTLLKEMAACVDVMARVFFGNELRCKADKAAIEEAKAKLGDSGLDEVVGSLGGMGALGGGALSLGDIGGMTGDGGAQSAESIQEKMIEKGQILGEQAALIFASIIDPSVVRVLVHAMLYGMRREAQAYTHNRNIGEAQDSVKLMSTLVQKSITALAATMYGCQDLPDLGVDYAVCEAVSQAMCQGAQMISRARTTQLMQEWNTEKFRKAAQDKIDAGDVDEADTTGLMSSSFVPEPTERAYLIGFAYCGFVRDGSKGAYQEDLPRKLVVMTSRLNLAIFSIPDPNPDGSLDEPDQDMLTFDSFRDLSWLKCIITHPRMGQFISLVWKKGKSESPDGHQHEVFIFECFHRRAAFREALKRVVRYREKKKDPVTGKEESRPDELEVGPNKHVPEILPPCRFSLLLRKAAKDTNMQRSMCQLVCINFIRADPGIFTQPSEVEAMILTRDAIVCISLLEFISAYKTEVIEGDSPPEPKLVDADSDDDADEIAPLQFYSQTTEMDDMTRLSQVRGTWQLANLQGVWFMAAEAPIMKVDFGKVWEIVFFTDGARQRFRQHLATTLKEGQEEHVPDDEKVERGKKWKVQPTRKENMPEVKKELKETERGLLAHIERVQHMTALALKH